LPSKGTWIALAFPQAESSGPAGAVLTFAAARACFEALKASSENTSVPLKTGKTMNIKVMTNR